METTELYRHWDGEGRLLYVGITKDGPSRLNGHYRESFWWPWIQRITIERFPSRKEALGAETRAIREEAPMFNKAQVPRDRRLGPSNQCQGEGVKNVTERLDFEKVSPGELRRPERGERLEYADDDFPTLRLRVGCSGRMSWSMIYRLQTDRGRGPMRRHTLGKWPWMDHEAARAEAVRVLGWAAKGIAPGDIPEGS